MLDGNTMLDANTLAFIQAQGQQFPSIPFSPQAHFQAGYIHTISPLSPVVPATQFPLAAFPPPPFQDVAAEIPQRPRKRVRFSKDCKTTCSTSSVTSAKDWISENSLRRIQGLNQKLASTYKTDDYCQAVSFLMTSHSNDKAYHPKDLTLHVTQVIKQNCRGLERAIVPEVARRRRRTLRAVLSLQRKLKKDGLLGTKLAEDLLREKSQSESQPLRQLAFRLGQADEYEAKHAVKSQWTQNS